ncbi:hypothetical protein B0H10DRAFT_2244302 [Mycena sp. CBHHK59/15]|nr:hypothetical protein B0H10DRAFT_2244302 [Mycena sp. CBHHK59/15]
MTGKSWTEKFGGAGTFGVLCLRTHHAHLGEALNIWPHWATPIKIGGSGARAFHIAFPKTHHNRLEEALNICTAETHHNCLEEALNVWPYWATPIKIGGGAADPFHVVCLKSQHHRLGEVLNDWCARAYLTNPSKLAATAQAHSTSGAQKDTAEVEGGS